MLTQEESDEIASISGDMRVYQSETLLKFIRGTEPLDNFDEFRANMKTKFRMERYTEIMQAQYDKYLER
jgi:putative aldouronate transport system substrate-binding protein